MDEILLKFIDEDWNCHSHMYVESKDFDAICKALELEFTPSVNQLVADSYFINEKYKTAIVSWLIRRALGEEVLR